MNKFNLDKLVKVRVNDFYPSNWYYYFTFKPKKYFWQSERKEGTYRKVLEMEYIKDVPKNHTLKDGVIYENPEVVMHFQGGIETNKYFDNIDKAQAFAEELTKGKNWLLN
jgi:hypothetical protein